MNKLVENSPFGPINLPETIEKKYPGGIEGGVIGRFLNWTFQALIIGASVYALFNLILAGYAFMSAGDDPKKMAGAWAKIWQTFLGLAFAAGAYVLAAIIGQLIFGEADFILKPKIPTP